MGIHTGSQLTWSFHTWMGFVFVLLAVTVVIVPWARKASTGFDALVAGPEQRLAAGVSDDFKKVMMLVLAVAAVLVYAYCLTCAERGSLYGPGEKNIFHVTARLSMRVFPFFIIGCFLAGVIEKYFRAGRIPIPRSMIGNGVLASFLPICSCAVVPLARSMLHLNRVPVRAVITFLMVAPILNPVIIPLSYGTLGGEYLVLRIVSTFVLAMAAGLIVERWAGVRQEGEAVFSCVGCSRSSAERPEHSDSALMLGWNTMTRLLHYILIGLAIGAMFSVFVPPSLVGKYLSNGSLGLAASALFGIPLYICAGEEVILLLPLMEMGLPMGYAIAFTISGNAICVTSIAVLLPVLGKRATFIMVGVLLAVSIIAGALINAGDRLIPFVSSLVN